MMAFFLYASDKVLHVLIVPLKNKKIAFKTKYLKVSLVRP